MAEGPPRGRGIYPIYVSLLQGHVEPFEPFEIENET